MVLVVKNQLANAGDQGSVPGWGRSPGEGNGYALQYSWPGESHGQKSLVGYSPWDCKESDTTIVTNTPATPCTALTSLSLIYPPMAHQVCPYLIRKAPIQVVLLSPWPAIIHLDFNLIDFPSLPCQRRKTCLPMGTRVTSASCHYKAYFPQALLIHCALQWCPMHPCTAGCIPLAGCECVKKCRCHLFSARCCVFGHLTSVRACTAFFSKRVSGGGGW